MSEVNVVSRVQRIVVEPGSKAVSIINAGPIGPAGPAGISGVAGATTLVDSGAYYTSDNVEGALQEVGATTVASTADATQALADAATADAKAVTADGKAVAAQADADAAQADATQALADAASASSNADDRVLRTGDTMTGTLTVNATGTADPYIRLQETTSDGLYFQYDDSANRGRMGMREDNVDHGFVRIDRAAPDVVDFRSEASAVRVPNATTTGDALSNGQSAAILAGLDLTDGLTVSEPGHAEIVIDSDGYESRLFFNTAGAEAFLMRSKANGNWEMRDNTNGNYPVQYDGTLVSLSFTNNNAVRVPDASAAGEALAYDQSGWQLDSGTVTGVVTFTDSTDHPIKLDAGVGELGNIRYQRNGVNKFAVGLNSANDEFRIYADDLGADAVVVATGGAVDMSSAPSVVVPTPIYPDSAARLETVTDAVAEAAVYTDAAIASKHAIATALPPVSPVPGQSWVMTPVDHIAMYTASGWKPVWPQTDNQAVTTGNAFNGVQGLWVASEGD